MVLTDECHKKESIWLERIGIEVHMARLVYSTYQGILFDKKIMNEKQNTYLIGKNRVWSPHSRVMITNVVVSKEF